MGTVMLRSLSPAAVFLYFEEIASIPRGSGNCGGIADYIEAFAKKRALFSQRDSYNNIIIKKPGTGLLQDAPTVMLQGHLDMVCEKVQGSTHDFTSEPLPLQTDGRYIWSQGTTLGADDGIAVAMMLAVLDDAAAVHPPLECVFTSDEEIGLIGAQHLDLSGCSARYLINLDCDEDGVFITGCCGGVRVRYQVPISRTQTSGYGKRLILEGLQGGHSGAQIHKNGGNAVGLLARILQVAGCTGLVSICGGDKDNVIPSRCEAMVLGDGAFADAYAAVYREYGEREPDMQFLAEDMGWMEVEVLSVPSRENVLHFLTHVPWGVLSMHPDIEGLVGTSANLAAVETRADCVCGTISVRSESETDRDMVCDRIAGLLAPMEGSERRDGAYPGWAYSKDSILRQTMVETWKEMFGEAPETLVIHAGLECGVLQSKLPELDAIAFGPEILDIHTPGERLNIASVEKNYRFLLEVLQRLGKDTHA